MSIHTGTTTCTLRFMRPVTSRSAVMPLMAMSIVALFTAQQLRLFLSGLSFALSDAREIPPEVVGLVGIAISALGLIGVMFVSSLNRSFVVALVSVVCVARLASQLAVEPLLLLAVASVGVVVAGLTIPAIALVHGGRITGVGLVLGGAIDIAIMGGRHTMDLTRSTSLAGIAIVVGASVLALLALAGEQQTSGFGRQSPPVPAAAAFAIGPWLALHLTVTGNMGFIGSVTQFSLGAATAVAGVGAAMALAWAAPGQNPPHPAAAASVATAALFLLGSAEGGWAAFLIVVASIAAGGAVTGAFDRETSAPRERVAWAAGAGMVAGFLGLIVVYLPVAGFGVDSRWTLGILALPLMGAGIACIPTQSRAQAAWPVPAVVAGLLLVIPGFLLISGEDTDPESLAGDPFVLTYNMRHGFGVDGAMALESMARIIESVDPDIVALQEVSRGWVATGGVDMVAWLEHRLGMPVIFAPSADRQWGVALATRLPTANPLVVPLGGDDEGLARAALDVPVDISTEQALRVIVTQLHQIASEQGIRQRQVNDLLVAWGAVPRTLVIGDLGAGPEDAITSQLRDAGLLDAGRLIDGSPATWPAFDPLVQLDYIWHTRDLALSVVRVLPLVASDHLAVLVRVGSTGVLQPLVDDG